VVGEPSIGVSGRRVGGVGVVEDAVRCAVKIADETTDGLKHRADRGCLAMMSSSHAVASWIILPSVEPKANLNPELDTPLFD
jgi:hypothetical protein